MLRKFNASYLSQGSIESNLLGMDLVDMLHGRGKNKTRESYFMDNLEYLKLEYIRAMSNISLDYKYDYKIVNGKVKVLLISLQYFFEVVHLLWFNDFLHILLFKKPNLYKIRVLVLEI